MNIQKAGFVGLGLMGAPMAANLVRKGWAVTAWNRSAAALDAFEELGGRVPATWHRSATSP